MPDISPSSGLLQKLYNKFVPTPDKPCPTCGHTGDIELPNESGERDPRLRRPLVRGGVGGFRNIHPSTIKPE